MADRAGEPAWRFVRFGLIVTGEGEEACLPHLFRSLAASGRCAFEVIRRIGQRSPVTSPRRTLRMAGTGKAIPDRDAEEIGLPARRYLSRACTFVVLVDDLEHERTASARGVFQRYRDALDTILRAQNSQQRASVHFLVNMLEAYYFADPAAINAVLGTDLTGFGGDVELIRNPKAELRNVAPGFRETTHGVEIVRRLDVPRVLSRPDTCASLRALFAWCWKAMGQPPTARYQLERGAYSIVTGPQLADL